MKNINILLLCIFAILISACGGEDDYTPTDNADTQAPTAPLNLVATNITENSVQLSWSASTDNIGVTGYKVFQNGIAVLVNISATTATISGLAPDMEYLFNITAVDAATNESSASNSVSVATLSNDLTFLPTLSQMGVYAGNLSNLDPAAGVQLYEINSALFTDYAEKQRLVRLPRNTKMSYNNSNLLPNFPDNTLIAKTFYYNLDETNPSSAKKIIETRILLKVDGVWLAGDYIWNAAQTEATFTTAGSEVPVTYTNASGIVQNINYLVPSQQDCFTCHNNAEVTRPIGMKLRNMNFVPSYTSQNQLDYLTANGFLENVNSATITVLPDWTDAINTDILDRGRAYIDINCAHCHQPGGPVVNFGLDFRLETIFEATGIYANRGEIEARIQSDTPTYRMPQLGRTINHEEAVAMLLEYLQAIED